MVRLLANNIFDIIKYSAVSPVNTVCSVTINCNTAHFCVNAAEKVKNVNGYIHELSEIQIGKTTGN